MIQDVHVLVCSEIGQGKLGQNWQGLSISRSLQTGSANARCTTCGFSHRMPCARTGKTHHWCDVCIMPFGFVHTLPPKNGNYDLDQKDGVEQAQADGHGG